MIRLEKAVLTIVSIFSGIAVAIAYSDPATEYELSIYSATPTMFWICVIASILISVPLIFLSSSKSNKILATASCSWAILLVIALPIIRGYHYYGPGDSMAYLGAVRELSADPNAASNIIYPFLPLSAINFHYIMGVSLEHGVLILLPIYSIIYMLFIPLTVRNFTSSSSAIFISALISMLFLPVNQVSRAGVFLFPYPTLLALLIIPLLIFLLSNIIAGRNTFIVLSIIPFGAIVFVHPQQAANIILVLGTITVGYLFVSRNQGNMLFPRPIFVFLIVVTAIFWIWVSRFTRFEQGISAFVGSIIGQSGTAGDISSVSSSLALYGGSTEELFVKIFLVSFIFCVIVGLYGICLFVPDKVLPVRARGVTEKTPVIERLIVYSIIPIIGLFILYLGFSSQYFRHLGFIMVIVSILTALALRHSKVVTNTDSQSVASGITVLFIVFLLLSVPIIHVSPYIFQPSGHVTEQQTEGFSIFFEVVPEDDTIVRFRTSPERYYRAEMGWMSRSPYETSMNVFDYQEPPLDKNNEIHFVITQRDRDADVKLYNGLQVSQSDFEQFDSNPSVSKTVTTGGFDLYYQNTS